MQTPRVLLDEPVLERGRSLLSFVASAAVTLPTTRQSSCSTLAATPTPLRESAPACARRRSSGRRRGQGLMQASNAADPSTHASSARERIIALPAF